MAKKSLGYTELEWTCPSCSTRNPGPQKICHNCGTPQPDNVEFEQKAQEELIEDEEKLRQAKSGADIHCAYCGTRNAAGAENCSQCGAPLVEGARRRSGRVVGSHRSGPAQPIVCPNCSTENDPNEDICTNCGAALPRPEPKKPAKAKQKPAKKGISPILIAVFVIIILLCGGCFILANRTEDMSGRIEAVEWQRDIQIEGLVPVERDDWRNAVPKNADLGRCSKKLYQTQDNPAPGAREICGTPYSVDKGSGYAEVVQDCRYEVYEDWCEYTVEEWRLVDTLTLTGAGFNPQWPTVQLGFNQREGAREETYRCIFSTEDGQKTYATSNFSNYQKCEIGTRWNLEVNTFNAVRNMEPAE